MSNTKQKQFDLIDWLFEDHDHKENCTCLEIIGEMELTRAQINKPDFSKTPYGTFYYDKN
jgi:hypothetical protein